MISAEIQNEMFVNICLKFSFIYEEWYFGAMHKMNQSIKAKASRTTPVN